MMPGMSDTDVLHRVAERWDDRVSLTRDPVKWVQKKTREHLWRKQREIIESVRDNRYTAVPSAHDLGKSHIGSRTIAWWNDTHPTGSSFVVSTAPSAAQVSAILWREVAKVHRIAGLRGKINRAGYPQWFEGSELVGYGRKPADYEESAFQGIHALHVLIVIDEAGGIAKHLYDAIDALATNEYARVLAIGNPDDPGSHFAAICKPNSGWKTIQLDGLRSPNMTAAQILGDDPDNPIFPLTAALMEAERIGYDDEPVPESLRPYLLSPLWVEERIERWCGVSKSQAETMTREELGDLIRSRAAGSALFQAKVRGIFPTSTATGVIPLGWVEQAVARHNDWVRAGSKLEHADPGNDVIGVDVAYGGQDETVLAPRLGNIVTGLHRYRHADTTETAEMASAHMLTTRSTAVVDVIGIGAGVYDTLRRWRKEGRIQSRAVPFNAAAASTRTDKIGEFGFMNDRAAAWWKMREKLDPSKGSRVMLPDDERLKEELTAVKYKLYAGGRIGIESKDDIRKRLGRSTDTADAVIQAFWIDGLVVEDSTPVDWQREQEGLPAREVARKTRNSQVVDWAPEYEPVRAEDYLTTGYSSTLG